MARLVRRTQEEAQPSRTATGSARLALWVDTGAMEDQRAASACLCWSRCLCGQISYFKDSLCVIADMPKFLRFFKMALKFLGVTLFFALVVFKPVHDAYPETSKKGNSTESVSYLGAGSTALMDASTSSEVEAQGFYDHVSTDYLWMYLIFAYLFSALAIYLMVSETVRIIDIRQEYLGNQATITDRTIRLSGIPLELRSEEKIKDFIEQLEIGKVDSVMLCKVWKELDDQVDKRAAILRKLEESWTIYDHQKATKGDGENSADSLGAEIRPYTDEPSDEETGEQSGSEQNGSANGNTAVPWPHDRNRPKATVRYGPLNFRSRYVDAIELYEAQLQETDESIAELRKKSFQPTPLAFVTMDSVAACVSVYFGNVIIFKLTLSVSKWQSKRSLILHPCISSRAPLPRPLTSCGETRTCHAGKG